ncbi:MAG: phospholipid-binding protein [Planctomycetes bacterium]|nr:phospholipid-binding protein [Planctomycetota bacterium]
MSELLATLNPIELAETVERSVQHRTGGRVKGLRVDVVDGLIVVSGRTSTYYNKQLVTHAAMDAAEETPFLNQVVVC